MKKLFSVLLAVLIMTALASCSGDVPANYVYSVEDVDGKTVGVMDGTASAGYMERFAPEATVRTYETEKSLAAALESGEIDCALADPGTYRRLTKQSGSITRLDEEYLDCDYRLAVSIENKEMLQRLNEALEALEDSGELESAVSRYLDGDAPDTEPDGTGQKVTVAVEPGFYPYAYYDDEGELRGLEIDVAKAVCGELGLEPEFLTAEPGMLLYMAESGKCSFAIGRLVLERDSEAVAYTDPYYHSTQYVAVRG